METNEVKQERSMPVNARVDVVDLAELARYWSNQGYVLRSVSQLVSWSMNLLREVLIANEQIKPTLDMISARSYLKDYGLTQPSNERRSAKKIATAIRFTQMRREGLNPKYDDPMSYNEVHNSHSVSSPQMPVDEQLQARIDAQRELIKEQEKKKEERLKAYREKNIIVSSSDKDILAGDKVLNEQLDALVKQNKGE